jgi:hypothetical protein
MTKKRSFLKKGTTPVRLILLKDKSAFFNNRKPCFWSEIADLKSPDYTPPPIAIPKQCSVIALDGGVVSSPPATEKTGAMGRGIESLKILYICMYRMVAYRKIVQFLFLALHFYLCFV